MGPGALRADDPLLCVLAPTSLIGKVHTEPGHRAICDILFLNSFGYAES